MLAMFAACNPSSNAASSPASSGEASAGRATISAATARARHRPNCRRSKCSRPSKSGERNTASRARCRDSLPPISASPARRGSVVHASRSDILAATAVQDRCISQRSDLSNRLNRNHPWIIKPSMKRRTGCPTRAFPI